MIWRGLLRILFKSKGEGAVDGWVERGLPVSGADIDSARSTAFEGTAGIDNPEGDLTTVFSLQLGYSQGLSIGDSTGVVHGD